MIQTDLRMNRKGEATDSDTEKLSVLLHRQASGTSEQTHLDRPTAKELFAAFP